VLRKISGPKTDGVIGEWRRLHKEQLYDLYCSSNIIRLIKSRRMRWAGHVACTEDSRGVYRLLVGKHEGKRPLGRPRLKWKDNIKIDLEDGHGEASIGLIWLRMRTGGGFCNCGNELSGS
jgi:hypothetical protein